MRATKAQDAQPRYRALAANIQNKTIHLEVDSGVIACASKECPFAQSVRLFALLIKKRSRHAVVGFEFLKKINKKLSTRTEMHGKQIYF